MNEVPNGPNMIGEFFREREGFANQPTASLTDRVVEPFNQTRFATGFIDGLVPFRGQHAGLDLIEIGETHCPLTVFRWQGDP